MRLNFQRIIYQGGREVSKHYIVKKIGDISEEKSICGFRKRLITEKDFKEASFTFLSVYEATKHYHKKSTEFYYVLKGKGILELDKEEIKLEPGTLVMINPGTKHRAIGKVEALIIGIPPFNPTDTYEN